MHNALLQNWNSAPKPTKVRFWGFFIKRKFQRQMTATTPRKILKDASSQSWRGHSNAFRNTQLQNTKEICTQLRHQGTLMNQFEWDRPTPTRKTQSSSPLANCKRPKHNISQKIPKSAWHSNLLVSLRAHCETVSSPRRTCLRKRVELFHDHLHIHLLDKSAMFRATSTYQIPSLMQQFQCDLQTLNCKTAGAIES